MSAIPNPELLQSKLAHADRFFDLGDRIANRREALGLSKQDLARRLGTTVSWVIDLERSTWRWRQRSVVRLSEILRMPQLEIAVAAGMVSDLPGYPPQLDPVEKLAVHEQAEMQHLFGNTGHEERDELFLLVNGLTQEELSFVLAIVRQMYDRYLAEHSGLTRSDFS